MTAGAGQPICNNLLSTMLSTAARKNPSMIRKASVADEMMSIAPKKWAIVRA